MPPILSSLASRLPLSVAVSRHGMWRLAPTATLHLAALAVLLWSENDLVPKLAFVLSWGLLNCFWLALLRRPALSAALSLGLIVGLIAISRFKFKVLWMTANFIDVLIIDADTLAYLWSIFPTVRIFVLLGLAVAAPLAVLLWWSDPLRIRLRTALAGFAACLAVLTGLSIAAPLEHGQAFGDENYVSTFARSGVDAVSGLLDDGFLQYDPVLADGFRLAPEGACKAPVKRPHIILLHDESSFDIRAVNGIKVPEGYGRHFLSFDGKARKFVVEGAGGPSWFTEYNVLSGLSSRSFGRFQFFVTRVAAGRVTRGLPRALIHCGYRTFTNYPVFSGFLAARAFYEGTGVQHFVDGQQMGSSGVFEPDPFYYDVALRTIARERPKGPMFLYVYLTANHFGWDYPFHEELTTKDWRDPGNAMPEVNEWLRRQAMSERDYKDFRARLQHDFPGESFLIVRYGDHQPDFGKLIVDPKATVDEVGQRLVRHDLRYFTTYYAIDAINFEPANLSSALDPLDAAYLPIVVQEAAGLPLDPSFAEQKRILQRCKGLFYDCAGGAEARRFNRLLIDAGLIKGF
jgi:hypothetical protein